MIHGTSSKLIPRFLADFRRFSKRGFSTNLNISAKYQPKDINLSLLIVIRKQFGFWKSKILFYYQISNRTLKISQ